MTKNKKVRTVSLTVRILVPIMDTGLCGQWTDFLIKTITISCHSISRYSTVVCHSPTNYPQKTIVVLQTMSRAKR